MLRVVLFEPLPKNNAYRRKQLEALGCDVEVFNDLKSYLDAGMPAPDLIVAAVTLQHTPNDYIHTLHTLCPKTPIFACSAMDTDKGPTLQRGASEYISYNRDALTGHRGFGNVVDRVRRWISENQKRRGPASRKLACG